MGKLAKAFPKIQYKHTETFVLSLLYVAAVGFSQELGGSAVLGSIQGVTKRCRLSLLTNSAHVYEPKCGGIGGKGGGG
jgi:hypothetical protein